MRPLEFTILPLNLIALLVVFLPVRPWQRWLRFLPALLVLLTLVHLAVEQYRWPMLFSYILTAGLFLLSLPSLIQPSTAPGKRGKWIYLVGAVALVWAVVGSGLPVLMPVPQLPTPPGPYAVGSVLYDWTDSSRAETYSTDSSAKRELMVQVWYPAQPDAGAKTAPFLDNFDIALPAMAQSVKFPAFATGHLRLVKTHTYDNAPIRAEGAPYPVVISSHGYTGYRTEGLSQMEALASSGYIAIAIEHPYATAFTIFSDGRVVYNDPAMLPPAGRNLPGDQAAREKLQAIVVADVRFVMDQLQLLNAGEVASPFAGKLDLQRIGLTGLSLGGGAITWTCQIDPRCKAGLAMDGWYEPIASSVLATPLRQPFMFMQSETQMWKMDNLARLDSLYQGVNAPAYHLKFSGVLHNDFSDYPLETPLSAPLMHERGTLNGARTVKIVDNYILAFFDQYLKKQPSALLQGPSPDVPEVQFKSR